MKFLGIFALIFSARARKIHHNDALRAGQYPETTFAPWKVHLS